MHNGISIFLIPQMMIYMTFNLYLMISVGYQENGHYGRPPMEDFHASNRLKTIDLPERSSLRIHFMVGIEENYGTLYGRIGFINRRMEEITGKFNLNLIPSLPEIYFLLIH